MDGDDAGINAVVRLCSSNVLSKVPELNRNELYVATLPVDDYVKDPADFVDFAGCGEKAQQRFQEKSLTRLYCGMSGIYHEFFQSIKWMPKMELREVLLMFVMKYLPS